MSNFVIYNIETGRIEAWVEETPVNLDADQAFIETPVSFSPGKYYKVDLGSKTVMEIVYATSEMDWTRVRVARNALIAQTDYVLTPDYPIEAELLEKVKTYRAALRNITETFKSPDAVVWPLNPLDK